MQTNKQQNKRQVNDNNKITHHPSSSRSRTKENEFHAKPIQVRVWKQ